MTLYGDEDWLVDEFDYSEYIKPVNPREPATFADTVSVKKCRISHKTVFSQDSSERKIVADGKIYCYASATVPFKEFKKQSKVIIDGEERVITKVKRFKEPTVDQVFSYELEFI